jgi:hypothetical protein
MGQDAPPPLIRQHSRNSHHTDKTSGKFTHTKKKNRKNLFFLSCATGGSWSFFMAPQISALAPLLEKIEREKRHSSW